jgi:hypothetical protein
MTPHVFRREFKSKTDALSALTWPIGVPGSKDRSELAKKSSRSVHRSDEYSHVEESGGRCPLFGGSPFTAAVAPKPGDLFGVAIELLTRQLELVSLTGARDFVEHHDHGNARQPAFTLGR